MSSPAYSDVPYLVIGCGYLGRRVATAWRAAGRRVTALTRHRADELARDGFEPIVGDVLDPASLSRLPPAGAILYAVGFDRESGRSMREVYVEGLANALQAVRCNGPFLFVSSTSVYGHTRGEWVTEDSPTEPLESSGRVVLEAEQTARRLRPDAIILRFAGIYGPNRVLRRQALIKGEPLIGDADKWLNLIHVDDGVSAVLAAEQHGRPGELYQIADDEPVRRRDFYTLSAQLLGSPPAAFQPSPTPAVEANRRVSNAKARAELEFAPRHPSYREGLRASLPIIPA
ncbi:SDR family oxidoreductase [Limnoglobus roseus]|uniref:NAD(P)-dependent oxidoreductase n=1 Tax=Limnoglobus roseus TaxID=2598579 RepID=A0A5C1AF52_9BACT|nr:SDR family oxidoreductase [Limnoglobus roseus]QEL15764.1 NAD(P)-dependent oxidoreductase [Limnoglobus roseus]